MDAEKIYRRPPPSGDKSKSISAVSFEWRAISHFELRWGPTDERPEAKQGIRLRPQHEQHL